MQQGCWFARVALLTIAASLSSVGVAQTPSSGATTTASTSQPQFIGQSDPAPDWMVWRSFQNSLQYYVAQSPDRVHKLLADRLGIDDATADQFLSLGKSYLETLKRLDSEDRTEMSRRFPTNAPPGMDAALQAAKKTLVQRHEPTAEQRATMSAKVSHAGANTSVRDVLEKDGTIDRLEAKRTATLDDHQVQLANLIGTKGYALLEGWIANEVRDKVRVIRNGTRTTLDKTAQSAQAQSR